jgi:hypothetical protein
MGKHPHGHMARFLLFVPDAGAAHGVAL